MSETVETCRRLYNDLLDDRIKNRTTYFVQQKALTAVRRENKFLRAIHSQVLQDVILRLDKAYGAFFAGISRHPKFRRRGSYNTFTYPQSGFKLEGHHVRLSLIGNVRVKLHRQIIGEIKRVTVIRDIDQWLVALLVEDTPCAVQSGDGKIGIDLGVTNSVALSDGTLVSNQRYLNGSASRIELLQRHLSHKRKGSRNREKGRIMLAKSWRKVRRQRDDFAHKLSDNLTKNNKLIVFEGLQIKNMVGNHRLASAIMDASWGKLRSLTASKAEWRGGRVILVNPNGTSQKCSGCGEVVPKELSERKHSCPQCYLVLDRDVNAARNILKAGLEQAHVEGQPLFVHRRRISKFAPVKQEAQS